MADLSVASAVTSSTAVNSAGKLSKDFDSFLKLLTTQMQNQDPTEPMDSNEMTAQLVNFANVEQQIIQSDLLEKLVTKDTQDQFLSASNLVGKTVEVFGNKISIAQGEENVQRTLVYAHGTDVARTKITIMGDSGVVYTGEGINTPGKHKFVWDGKDNNGNPVPPGKYTVKMEEQEIGSEVFNPMATNLVDKVTEVLSIEGSVYVSFGSFTVPFSDVLAVTQPGQTI